MTVQEFFDKYKGKKITQVIWLDGSYIIMKELIGETIHYLSCGGNGNTKELTTDINNVNPIIDWVVLDDTENKQESTGKCICESQHLFNFGCKCGAFQKEQEMKHRS